MIDTHCHLTDPRLAAQLDDVLTRAVANGVTRMITIGVDFDDARAAIALCKQHPNIRCAIGVHPNHSQDVDLSELSRLRELQADPSVVALGQRPTRSWSLSELTRRVCPTVERIKPGFRSLVV